MESKPAIEKFMQDYFQARTIALKRRLEIHHAIRQRFCASECFAGSRAGVVERSEAETIVDISLLEIGIGVVTAGADVNRRRSRYHLKPSGESWLIHEVDKECAYCRFHGVTSRCSYCSGSGWLNREGLGSFKFMRGEKRTDGVISRSPEAIPEAGLIHNPAVDQFMAEYFRAKSESWKKELEIQEDYTKRFYSPDGDWAIEAQKSNETRPESCDGFA
ncbi:MAG: hypothetical protein JWR26_3036 [Pedosphaera sp.]|nr:hypothetical protein [Pedosphaera sp.]